VQKLGYIDYRDALACNKYVLETKRHNDYHQMARSKILSHAMQKYNQQKKKHIESMVSAQAGTASHDEDRLKVIMNEDSDMAALYREIFQDIKEEKERE
jgi:hypothetical protein